MNSKQDITNKQRGGVHKSNSRPILVWFPKEIVDKLDKAVVAEDTDRSKFIRTAVRRHLEAAAVS